MRCGDCYNRLDDELPGATPVLGVAACHPTKPKLYLLPGGAQGGLFELQLE